MSIDILMLFVSLGMILLASVVFTNGIELLGHRGGLHQGITGSILAAVGTALPETLIPVIAILFFHSATSHAVGIGAIAGAPFMLATLAFCITGVAVMAYTLAGKRTWAIHTDTSGVLRDLRYFIILYGIAILASFFHHYPLIRWVLAIGLVLGYVLYIRETLASDGHEAEEVELLHLSKYFRLPENRATIAIQVIASLLLMMWGAHMFVGYVSEVSTRMGLSALILSIIITPIATELPEKCNSVIWIGKRKDILAVGNITGAMVFQSSFPVAFGVAFTSWDLTGIPLISALLALSSALMVYGWVKIKKTLHPGLLAACAVFYIAFIIYLVRR
ncbi:MAG: sodium:calcium antiporter [bacterium]